MKQARYRAGGFLFVFLWPSGEMEARKGLKNLSVVNRVGVQVPSGLSAPVPEWNMDMAKDHGFVGSNPTRSIYRHVAQRKTRCVQGTVSVGSNPTMSIYGRLPQRKTGPAQTRLFEGSNPLSFINIQRERGR